MAERRMFSRKIISAARFLRMPATARLLYYDLGMYADDDGIVEAFMVIQMTHASEDDLRVLVSKGFVQILNDDLVAYLCDWKINNFIRKDRYVPSLYQTLLSTGQPVVNPEQERREEENERQDSLGERKNEAGSGSPDSVSVRDCFENSFGRMPDVSFETSVQNLLQEGKSVEEICGCIRQSVRGHPRNPEAYILTAVRSGGYGKSTMDGRGGARQCAEDAPLEQWEINWLEQVQKRRKTSQSV